MFSMGKRLKSLLSQASKIHARRPPIRKYSKKKKKFSRNDKIYDMDVTNYVLIAGGNSAPSTYRRSSGPYSPEGNSLVCFSFPEAVIRISQSPDCRIEDSIISKQKEDKRWMDLFNAVRKEEFVEDGRHKKIELLKRGGRKLLKVMNYNVLSQSLLEIHPHLYIGVPWYILRWSWRYPRILAEIAFHDPDVLCLQEVQHNHLANFTDSLEQMGYKGVFKRKTGNKFDGCAIFYRTKSFELVDVALIKFYRADVAQLNRDNVGLAVKLRQRLQSSVDNNSKHCKDVATDKEETLGDDHDFVVATTHLLFNPRRQNIRLAQLQVFLAELHRFADWGHNGKRCAVILTGDFNSFPDSLVVKLVLNGVIHHGYAPLPAHSGVLPNCTLAQNQTGVSKDSDLEEGEIVEPSTNPVLAGMSSSSELNDTRNMVSHSFKFRSAYEFTTGYDTVATTFQGRWVTVDYIFYTCDRLELLSTVRLPTSQECEQIVGQLPNSISPSDHLPLIATFALGATEPPKR